MSTLSSAPGYPEPKAKRTHARRSCDVCKVRKTRCELPDLSVPSGSTPLPEDKACHRCRVLALPCIVNDTGRMGKKRKDASLSNMGEGHDGSVGTPHSGAGLGGGSVPGSGPGPGASIGARMGVGVGIGSGSGTARVGDKKRKVQSIPGISTNGGIEVDHDLDVLHSVHPSLLWTEGAAATPRLYVDDPFFQSPRSIPGERQMEMTAQHSLKLHGRPLELVSAMLRTAYAKTYGQSGRSEVVYERTDWDALLDASMRTQLQDMGYSQLRTFHPYLDPFHAQFDRLGTSSACNDQLLLSLIIYLCTFPLPPSSAVTQIRAHLRPKIAYLRDRVLLTAPQTFSTIHALDLLCTHGPLGVVPLQLADLSCLTVARGQMACLRGVGTILGFNRLFNTILVLSKEHAWMSSDTWLYISVTAAELASALEDEVSRTPASLAEVRPLTTEWMQEENEQLWREALQLYEPAELVGRLAVCDKVNRMAEVLDALERMRTVMDSTAADPTFNAGDAIQAEVNGYQANMELCDTRYNSIMAILSPHTQMIESGLQTYRAVHRRYQSLKVLGTSIRCLTALSFLPGHADSIPDLPNDMAPHHRVTYAMDRAHVAADMMAAVTRSTPSAMLIWRLGPERMNIAADLLTDFAVLDKKVIPQPRPEIGMARGDMVPLHEMCAIGVEAAKILMESKAGKMAMARNNPELMPYSMTEPLWDADLQKAISVLRRVDLLSTPFGGEGSTPAKNDVKGGVNAGTNYNGKHVKPGEGETIANGMSNLLGSMSRLADMWTRNSNAGTPVAGSHGAAPAVGVGAGASTGGGGAGPSTLAQLGDHGNPPMSNSSNLGMGPGSHTMSSSVSGPPPSAGLDMNMGGPDGYDDLAGVLGQTHGEMLAQHHHSRHDHDPSHHSHGHESHTGHSGNEYAYDGHTDHSHAHSIMNMTSSLGTNVNVNANIDTNTNTNTNTNTGSHSPFPHGPVLDHSSRMMSESGQAQGRYESHSHGHSHLPSPLQAQSQSQSQSQLEHASHQQFDYPQPSSGHDHAATTGHSGGQAKYYTATPHLGIRYEPGPQPSLVQPQQHHGHELDHGHGHGQGQYQSQQQQQYPPLPPVHDGYGGSANNNPGPTPLDMLIGQMFNYATYATVPPAGHGGGGR